VLNRKNALFAGHDQGAENWACIASYVASSTPCVTRNFRRSGSSGLGGTEVPQPGPLTRALREPHDPVLRRAIRSRHLASGQQGPPFCRATPYTPLYAVGPICCGSHRPVFRGNILQFAEGEKEPRRERGSSCADRTGNADLWRAYNLDSRSALCRVCNTREGNRLPGSLPVDKHCHARPCDWQGQGEARQEPRFARARYAAISFREPVAARMPGGRRGGQ
jgi:hypothetical protein